MISIVQQCEQKIKGISKLSAYLFMYCTFNMFSVIFFVFG